MLADIFLWLPPILFAITIHEVAHGLVAYHQGDPTAKYAGRLTLNPISHIDPLGILALIFFHIGWARPVPVNPALFKNPRRGMFLVAIAGPASNILLAIISALLFRIIVSFPISPSPIMHSLIFMLKCSLEINLILAFFNLMPIPRCDRESQIATLARQLQDTQKSAARASLGQRLNEQVAEAYGLTPGELRFIQETLAKNRYIPENPDDR